MTTTLPCTTCGHPVAPAARRCPSCAEKRPAATVRNLLLSLGGLAVVVVVLVAIVSGGHGGGGSSSGPVKTLVAQEGSCLSTAGVSTSGASVFPQMDGSNDVILGDGATFNVSGGYVYPKNGQATADLDAGGSDC